MKKLVAVSILGMLFLSVSLPLLWAAEDSASGTDRSATPEEFADLQKTMKQDRIDNLERRVADLEQANRFMNQRVQDVERSVYDFKSRT
jgi:hypothetical protein